MTTINFYELTTSPFEKVLPPLLQKILESGGRAIVLADADKVDEVDKYLWTFGQTAFLPHATFKDENLPRQPVVIRCDEDNQNSATYVVVTNEKILSSAANYEKCADIFDGTIPDKLSGAKNRMSQYKSLGYEVNHFRQKDKSWEKIM